MPDAAVLVTEWGEFKKLSTDDFIKNMKQPILVDGRRIYDPETYSKKIAVYGNRFRALKSVFHTLEIYHIF